MQKRGRQPEKISLFCAFPVSPLQSRAWSFVRLARMFCSTDQEKERPLVVYLRVSKMNNVWSYTCNSADTQSFNTADAFYTHNCAIQWSSWLKFGRLNMSEYKPRQFIAKYEGRNKHQFLKVSPNEPFRWYKYSLSTSIAGFFKKKLHVYNGPTLLQH